MFKFFFNIFIQPGFRGIALKIIETVFSKELRIFRCLKIGKKIFDIFLN